MNIKRITSVIASLAAVGCIWSSSVCAKADTKTLTLGDVNGDTLVNAVDASEVLSEYALTSTGSAPLFSDDQKLCGDVDKNGAVNAVDASHILSYYAYRSTGGTLMFEEYLNSQNVPPELMVNGYSKYDLLSPDKEKATKAFEVLSSALRDELYSYYIVRGDWGVTNGADQAKIILAILNYNQGISPEALASDEALGKFSKEDLIKSCKEANIPETQYFYEKKIDMHKYVIDEDTANYLEDITNKYFDFKNGNPEEMNAELKEYFKNCNAFNTENVDNFNIFYIMERISLNKIGEYEYGGELDTYIEKVIEPLYESYSPYINK